MKKWTNEAYVNKIKSLVESGETDVLLDTGKISLFIAFDPNFSVPYDPKSSEDYKDLAPYKEGDKIKFDLQAFGLVEKTSENKIRIEYEEQDGYSRIKEVIGRVVDTEAYDNILDIGGVFVKAIDKMKERAKIGDYVYCEFGNIHIQNIEKIEEEKK